MKSVVWGDFGSGGRFQRRQIENVYRALLSRPARLVTEDDLLKPVLEARTTTTKRAASYLSAVLRHSRLGDPARRAALDDAVPERARDRVLSDDEVARIFASDSPALDRDFFRGLVLTAQRSGDLATMQIEDVDVDAAVWNFQMQKSRSRATVHLPLSEAMLGLIRARVGARTHGSVFLGQRGGEIGNLGRRLRVLQSASSTASWSWHDCRRTSRTWMGRAGVPSYVAERALGHTVRGVEAVYDRWSYEPELRKAFEAVAAELARIESGGKVVRLSDRGR
jgi:integrase